jgi:acetate kinase
LHNPANLAGIEAIEAILKTLERDIPQVAVFDTAFHSTLAPAAYTYPGTYDWLTQGIRRYGFHGTSHQYCSEQVQTYLQQAGLSPAQRLITCHLGNGCSLAAIRDGRSVDTTMGFTPLDGLMMGTRSGSLDPGILLYLLRQHNLTVDQLDHLLNRESGLLGLSGVSNDLRSLLTAIDNGNSRAQLALDVFLHRLRSSIGAFLAILGGVDTIVFTAGIGENSALIRSQACQGFSFLGLELDEVANEQGRGDRSISTPASSVRVWVIQTAEEWTIARESIQILQ